MTTLVVDASVVVKWYIPERDHQRARALRDDYLDGTHDLCAPALLPFEVANALRYSGHYEGERLAEASTTLPEYGIETVPCGECGPVAEVSTELDVPVYDASYVALAHERAATVYTADERLLDAVEASARSGSAAHVRSYS